MTLDEAITRKLEAEVEFAELCQRGRETPNGVTVGEFLENRQKYLTACEEMWEGMFRSIAGTGVKVVR